MLKVWEMRNLTLQWKTVIVKTIAISKIVLVKELEKIQKVFFWKNPTSKTKHEILSNEYKAGWLKSVHILNKVIAFQCVWLRRFYDKSLHE